MCIVMIVFGPALQDKTLPDSEQKISQDYTFIEMGDVFALATQAPIRMMGGIP